MDNLNSHHNALVTQLIYNAGHKLAFRAPYYAVDGPIEYVFNTLQNYLRINLPRITDNESLLHELDNAIASIYNFERYFIHCGFWRI
jgi:transposase